MLAVGTRSASPATRRQEILDVAAAVFARQGIANTTVRDIGEEAGILSGSLYHHFSSKDEIVEEIIRAALDPDIELDVALAHSEVEPPEAVRQLLVRSLRFTHDHPDVAVIIANGRHELLAAERFDFLHTRGAAIRASWVAVLERGKAQGVFRADLDPDLTYKAVMGAVSAAPNWYRRSGAHDIDEIAEGFVTLFLRGITVRGDAPTSALEG
ncbi:MAG: TetR family transcriptional regulator [Acidimicrobiia bacterium]|nr:TetR family transcriptional regulator [Acidimicrobiia bacterium]